jgi:hypothetical protein
VIEIAIGLDHESPIAPEEVDQIWPNADIDLRQR